MTFHPINNTTPFFEGTDTHALMGHSSYSTTGTPSFTAIHTEVAGQEYIPFGAPATTSGPRRIGRDEFLEDIGGSGAIGEDKLVPVGDALLPMYIILTTYCVVRFLITHFKRGALMKKSFSILLLALMFSPFAHAQLKDGDIVTLRYEAPSWLPQDQRTQYYLEAGVNGLRAVNYPTDDCLWQMRVVKNGNNTNYTFQTLPREGQSTYYLSYTTTDAQHGQLRLLQNNNPTAFSFNVVESEEGKYMMGHMSTTYYYPSWYTNITLRVHENYSLVGWEDGEVDLYVEKWQQVGGGAPTGVFSPEKIEFTYAENDSVAQQQATPVTFTLNTEVESHYECVPRPDEVWLRRSTMDADMSQVQVTFYWESAMRSANPSVSSLQLINYSATSETENRALMTLKNQSPLSFTITPNGGSPMGLKQYIYSEDTIQGVERWVDYADRVIAEYVVNGKTYKETMRVIRKSYHWEELPPFTFSVVPVTYTFAKDKESVDITVRPTHQHGRVLHNLDGQTIKTVYEASGQPTQVPLNTTGWELSINFTNNDSEWLSWKLNGDYKIQVTAEANETGPKRTSEMTGTFKGPDGHSGTFTIPLAQRYIEGGIQFYTQAGQGASDEEKEGWNKSKDKQQVHTAERTIYYLPNQEIELRLPESGYSGYMRWYDYTTGMDPYYNENPLDTTSWILSPRAANNQPFFAINTPRSKDTWDTEGRSYGFVAFNKKEGANVGGHLDEGNTSNQAPRIKGWNYNTSTLDSAYQIMACDVSAYTDYTINQTTVGSGWNTTVRIDSITEPTLSYRQLFHLKPASEMADKFDDLKEGEYLENYHYKAPAGKMVLLATEFRYRKARSHFSEMCYFYRDGSGEIIRLDETTATFTWQADGATFNPQYTAEMDYLWVRSDNPKTVVYTLTANAGGKTWRIAKFTVQYVPQNTHGPSSNTLITEARMRAEYKVLASINFNSSNNHLPWDESSYGFMYSSGELATEYVRGASQGVFPFYGEYFLVDRVNKDWAKAEQHGGAGKGYALYVDGTMEPGLVASISADARICSDQTMYCSAWFCNPTPQNWNSEGNPIFRCNVQGRNIVEIVDGKTTFTPWEDVEMYFVGELPKNSGWQQIFFPIESAHSYDETRVSIYNFATTNLGNDFLVDDIHLFVSQMPIVAYQGKMACRSIDSDTTSAAAVLRIDYSNIQSSGDGFMYYQIYNETYKDPNDASKVGAPVVLRGKCAYYHADSVDHIHNNQDDKYGSVAIPPKSFDPKKHNDQFPENKVDTFLSVSKFLDELVERGERHGRAYVRTVNSGVTKWLLYVAHIIPNTHSHDSALVNLYDKDSYVMRMAYTPNELATPECNMQTHIHATQRTIFELRNSDGELINQRDEDGALLKAEGKNVQHFMMHSVKNCANELYFLDIKVVNHLAVSTGAQPNDEEAPIYADWLVGEPMDDIFGQEKPTDSIEAAAFVAKQKEIDAKFKEKYGYTHGQVTTAIMYDMRRLPDPQGKTIKEKNPNYYARSFKELDPNAFLSPQNYDIVRHLHEQELLHMYDTTVYFYLASQDTARYWAFPIAETAKTIIEGKTAILKDCNEPRWVTVSSQESDYFLNITPLDKKDKNFIHRTQIPTIKVVKKNSNTLLIPIKEIAKNGDTQLVKLLGKTYTTADTITLKTSESELPDSVSFYDVEHVKTIATPTIEAGKEYTIRIPFQSKDNWDWIGNNHEAENACRIGYVYFNLAVVPDVLVWQPIGESFNGWGKDENWKGVVDINADGIIDDKDQIDSTKLIEGYVPMAGTNVIIPKLNNPLLYPYIVPEEEHNHYPMTVYHDQHKCDTIYFADSAHINNQHLLEYKAAFVDMEIPVGTWTMVSAPLQDLYAGDFFIPHIGDYNTGNIIEEHNPFMVEKFQGSRSSYAAYAFYASYYNRAVKNWYTDGSVKETTSTDFVMSNSLGDAIHVGSGVQLMGFGLANDKDLNIRLPKPDTQYTSSSGAQGTVTIDKKDAHLLAFTPNKEGNMTITLRNALADSLYVFGNPTMAFINMHEFLHANDEVLEHVYYRFQGEAWQAYTSATASIDRFLPPMEAVLLKAKDKASTSIEVVLKAAHLTLDNRINPLEEHTDPAIIRKTSAKAPVQDNSQPAVMTIYAITDKAYARTVLATSPTAHDYYHSDEDALFISSGVEAGTSSVLRTPMNMYTVAEQVPMMADVRQGISSIPLSMLVYEKNRQSQMTLAFYLSQNWNKEVYLLDSITGARTRILNGLMLTVPMPDNHQLRYYIEGPDEYIGEEDKPSTPTDLDTQTAHDTKAYKVLHNQQIYILRNGHTYTLTGLEVK